MEKKTRLTGVDLCRGVSACAVVVQHVGNGVNNDFTIGAATLKDFCSFAVPFFLATSLYLTIDRLYINRNRYSLKSRYKRILLPYVFWSIFYSSIKCLEHLYEKNSGDLSKLFSDPLAITFFGHSSYQLYFLPLLFLGVVLVKIPEYLIRKQVEFKVIISLFVLSLIVYELLLISGNSYGNEKEIAFEKLLEIILPDGNKNPLIRLILVELAWTVRCLPYIFTAMILSYPSIKQNIIEFGSKKNTVILFTAFIVVNAFGQPFFPESVYEIIRGYSFLLFAILLSENIKENRLITSLSSCSFGIYLIHIQILHFFKIVVNTIIPTAMAQISVITMITLVVPTFLVSWIVTSLLMRKKIVAELMFGV